MEFDYIEIAPRPKKDGLHDSGFRFIRVTGVMKGREGANDRRIPLEQWADVVRIEAPTRLDVDENGIIRMWAEGGKIMSDTGWLSGSTCELWPSDWRRVLSYLQTISRIRGKG